VNREPSTQSSRVIDCSVVGLERILRGIQSLIQIFTAWPLLLTYLSSTVSIEKAALLTIPFQLLQARIGLVRRVIRTFRFLPSFTAGWLLYQRQSPDQGIELWLDVLSKTTLGMYGMLETITLLDVFEVPGVEVFGQQKTKEYNRQAQIYWFVALLASAASNLVRMSKVSQSTPGGEEPKGTAVKRKTGKGRKSLSEKAKDEAVVGKDAQAFSNTRQLSIKIISDMLDMLIPAAVVGWINLDRGFVASAMLLTTFITGSEVWHRCGREVDAKAS
jgi:hypothetical protein